MRNCQIYGDNPTSINFILEIKIPVGFVIESSKNYAIDLVIDQSNLQETKTINTIPWYTFSNNEIQEVPNASPYFTKVIGYKLEGSIGYNVVARGFKPAKLLSGERTTMFTSQGTVEVDMDLGYRCYEEASPDSVLDQFDRYIKKGTEFIVDQSGWPIPYCGKWANTFLRALSFPDYTWVVYIPYTIIFRPKMFRGSIDGTNRSRGNNIQMYF